MTSNTEPWGEVIASSSQADAPSKNAFDGSETTDWTSVPNSSSFQSPQFIGYKFGNKTKLKMFTIRTRGVDTTVAGIPTKFSLYGANGGAWEKIADYTNSTLTSRTRLIYDVNSTKAYEDYKVEITEINKGEAGSYYAQLSEVQFFGLDYSEHEERHWIYDHGVELEPISGNGLVKENGYARSDATSSTNAITMNENPIDLTPYTLARLNIVCKGDATGIHAKQPNGTSLGYTMVFSTMPYSTYHNVSNVNEPARIVSEGGGTGNYAILYEMWLE